MRRVSLSGVATLLLGGVFSAAPLLDARGATALSTFLDGAVKRGDVPAVVAICTTRPSAS